MGEIDKRIADLFFITLPLAVLYFCGLIYLSVYLAAFSIQITEVELPIQIVVSYSFNVFSSYPFLVFLSIVLFFAIYLNYAAEYRLLRRRVSSVKIYTITKLSVSVGFIFVLFLCVYYISESSAKVRADLIRSGKGAQQIEDRKFYGGFDIANDTQKLVYETCTARKLLWVAFSDAKADFLFCRADGYFVLFKVESGGKLMSMRAFK